MLEIKNAIAHRGYDLIHCWVRPMLMVFGEKVGMMPSLLEIAHPDCFSEKRMIQSDDGGESWSSLQEIAGLKDAFQDGQRLTFNPAGCEPLENGRFLVIGQTIAYDAGGAILDVPHRPFSCVYDMKSGRWSEPVLFDLGLGEGCSVASDPQVVREGEDWLIPFYVHFSEERTEKYDPFRLNSKVVVVRCRVSGDGEITPDEKSDFLSCEIPRGFGEPALCKFRDRYVMTLRNDESGYIVSSDDWRKWPVPQKLQFDDGSWLGSYNTMTKLLVLGEKLYLVYTRKGLNNDHVFRHRAPLLAAELAPESLKVIRHTEQILVPEYGARLGNFCVQKTSASTAGVAVAEWMSPELKDLEYGSDNRIWFVAVRQM